MKPIVTLIAVFSAVTAAACAERSPSPDSVASDVEKQRVLAAEDAYVAAEVNRDEPALQRLVDDHFVSNSAAGTTSGKEELIRTVLSMGMTGQTISERSVVVDGDLAVVFGTTELQFHTPGEQERVSRLRYTSVYVKRDDAWRMLALHMQPRAPN